MKSAISSPVIKLIEKHICADAGSVTFAEAPVFISRKYELSPKVYTVFVNGRAEMILKQQEKGSSPVVGRVLCKEYLSLLSARRIRSVRDTLPDPVYYGRLEDHAILLESYVRGERMSDRISFVDHQTAEKHFETACRWLAGLMNETIEDSNLFSRRYHLEMAKLAKNFPENFRALADYFDCVPDNMMICKCAKHGDFFMSNLFVSEDDLITGVVDLEDFSTTGFPLEDLYNFIVTYLFGLERAGKKDMANAPEFKGLISAVISQYNKTLGLTEAQMNILFKYYWMVSVNRQMGRLRKNPEIAMFRLNKINNRPDSFLTFVDGYLEE